MRTLLRVVSFCVFAHFALGGLWAQVAPAAAAVPGAAGPQDDRGFPPAEVYAGIGYGNLSSAALASRKHSGGWSASVTWNATRYFGLTADFAGFYNPECSDQDINCFLDILRTQRIEDYSQHHFLIGPRFTAPLGNKRIFFHALVGGARTHGSIFNFSTNTETSATFGPDLAVAFGGGMDWSLSDRFAVRLFEVDSIAVRESPDWRNNIRVQGGVVIRFGKR